MEIKWKLQKKKLDTAEIQFFRHVCGWIHFTRENEDVRDELEMCHKSRRLKDTETIEKEST